MKGGGRKWKEGGRREGREEDKRCTVGRKEGRNKDKS
jgi:hypothetical protein